MFRKPRDTSHVADVGRPPSPKPQSARTSITIATPPNVPPSLSMAAAKTRAASKPVPLPTIGRQGPAGSAKKSIPSVKGKEQGNGNILSFFKREEAGLFIQDGQQGSVTDFAEEYIGRFNEDELPSKRRRLSGDQAGPACDTTATLPLDAESKLSVTNASAGPFMEDSDSDSEHEAEQTSETVPSIKSESDETATTILTDVADTYETVEAGGGKEPVSHTEHVYDLEAGGGKEPVSHTEHVYDPPTLLKQETSFAGGLDQFKDFEGMEEDFDEDLFEEGDEFMERRYMEEQARFEAMEAQDASGDTTTTLTRTSSVAEVMAQTCPICDSSLDGVSEQEAALHVNNCLDGNPTPIKKSQAKPVQIKAEGSSLSPHQFRRPVRNAKPGQQNPFTLGESTMSGGSAFNKLMSGHAEDAAWAEAAASEHASRGKPSYQRTCPFYKILPGFNICVDAFRYGAVEGCQAYFLSHFHSDHYVGLTSSWCHGPIYCSKVTGNLVRQQLRVDPKYVVDLEFEKTVEIPGTRGVRVTMIPANHCPGSSLYLFEKSIGTRINGQPKLQRVLHCGDFRACRMHVQHPLLMPSVRDKITGKLKDQKIDVCYLDTTYLNPKYAFPCQEAVIKACADMCVSLSRVTPDESDGWEQMKRQRAGEGMAKFIRRESSGVDKTEETADHATADDMKVEANPNASQQILSSDSNRKTRGRLLVVVGTYSIGKERICLGIAKALNSKIYAPSSKQRIVAALEDPELNALMTPDPRAAQVHMTPLFEIRAETLDDYLKDYFPHFTRAVGFRPSGWNYRPPNSRFTESPTVQTVLYSDNWKSTYSMRDLVPQRGSSSRASCFGVPYSEHSSFRELTMFCCALRIEKVIPTVNVGSAKSRERMKAWIERWSAERRKNGLYELPEDGSW